MRLADFQEAGLVGLQFGVQGLPFCVHLGDTRRVKEREKKNERERESGNAFSCFTTHKEQREAVREMHSAPGTDCAVQLGQV